MRAAIRFVGVLFLLAVTGACTYFAGRSFAGELYLKVAGEAFVQQPGAEGTRAAAQLAVDLAPWNVEAGSALGKALRASGDPISSRSRLQLVLLQAPGNPVRWQDVYEAALSVADVDVMQAALLMVQRLAPRSNALKLRNALIGQRYWDRGTAGMRALWVTDARNSLLYRRRLFLYYAYQSGLEQPLCARVPPQAHAATRNARFYLAWCNLAPEARKFCTRSQPMTDKQKSWCVAMGADF